MQFDRVRWARKWRQMRLNLLTRDVLAPPQAERLQRCGELDLAEVTLGGKKRGIGENEEEGQLLRLEPHAEKFRQAQNTDKMTQNCA